MEAVSAENLHGNESELRMEAWAIRQANFPNEIEFDFPVKTKSITVTGESCALKCAHCNGHFLKHMLPIEDWNSGLGAEVTSCLVSGGCDSTGKVPVANFLPVLQQIRQTKRRTNLHVGLIDDEEIQKIAEVADVISFDFVGDNETIREVYGLDKTVEDYKRVYQSLQGKVLVLPHICIGLRGGKISGEFKALEILSEMNVPGLVFIVLSPTSGTSYADVAPPDLEEVEKLLCTARKLFPSIPIHLGCMRPKGQYRLELDKIAVQSGVNKIVQPTRGAMLLAEELGLTIKRGEECCVL